MQFNSILDNYLNLGGVMNNRIKIILLAALLMALVYGADRVLKMQGNNYVANDRDFKSFRSYD